MKIQQNNKRNNRMITYKGETLSVSQWSEKIGIKKVTLISRLNSGWSIERALTEKINK